MSDELNEKIQQSISESLKRSFPHASVRVSPGRPMPSQPIVWFWPIDVVLQTGVEMELGEDPGVIADRLAGQVIPDIKEMAGAFHD